MFMDIDEPLCLGDECFYALVLIDFRLKGKLDLLGFFLADVHGVNDLTWFKMSCIKLDDSRTVPGLKNQKDNVLLTFMTVDLIKSYARRP